MATTTPEALWSPDPGTSFVPTTDLALMQSTVQTAFNAVNSRKGTTTQRNAYPAVSGDYWYDTTLGALMVRSGTTWLYAPGQILGYMSAGSNYTGASGTLVGSMVSTPVLPVGQRVMVTASYSQFSPNAGGQSQIRLAMRNNSANVQVSINDKKSDTRGYSPTAGAVVNTSTPTFLYTTALGARITAAIYLANSTSGVFGGDGIELWVASA